MAIEQEAFFSQVRAELQHEAANRRWTKSQIYGGFTTREAGEAIVLIILVVICFLYFLR